MTPKKWKKVKNLVIIKCTGSVYFIVGFAPHWIHCHPCTFPKICRIVDAASFANNAQCLRFICPIAYSTGQIICLCAYVCMSVCLHSHDRISWLIFAKSKNEFVGGQHRTTPSLFCPLKRPLWAKRSWKIHAYINMQFSALKVCELPEFRHHTGNRGRGTRRWRPISDRK